MVFPRRGGRGSKPAEGLGWGGALSAVRALNPATAVGLAAGLVLGPAGDRPVVDVALGTGADAFHT